MALFLVASFFLGGAGRAGQGGGQGERLVLAPAAPAPAPVWSPVGGWGRAIRGEAA